MASRRLKISHQQIGLADYLSNWHQTMSYREPNIVYPQAMVSLIDNTRDLSVMLSYLDNNLVKLESTSLLLGQRFDYQAYSDARTFLKICYLLVRILFNDVTGIIRYFYDINEPNTGIPYSFNELLKKGKNGKLPEDLSTLLKQIVHFPIVRDRRNDLEHYWESLLISLEKDSDGKIIVGHFSTKKKPSKEYESIRESFGSILSEYQYFIDNLLDHFDNKFISWYGFKPSRVSKVIADGYMGIMLWWAHKYGDYSKNGIVIINDSYDS